MNSFLLSCIAGSPLGSNFFPFRVDPLYKWEANILTKLTKFHTAKHYENTHIQIYTKFHIQKLKTFR